MCKETVNFAYEEESNTFRQYLCILVRIDSALIEDDPEQHWTNNYNYENKESILTNKQKAIEQKEIEQTWQNWMMNHLKHKKRRRRSIYINITACLLFSSHHSTSMTHLTLSEQSNGWQTHTNTNQNHISF